MGELFTEFDFTKELESKLEQTQSARQFILDSLKLDLELIISALQVQKQNDTLIYQYNVKKGYYLEKQKQFEEDNRALKNEYDNQIWDKLNLFVEEYSKTNNMEYVFGANGSGSLMYGAESKDLTEELILYCNKKFSGE